MKDLYRACSDSLAGMRITILARKNVNGESWGGLLGEISFYHFLASTFYFVLFKVGYFTDVLAVH